MQIEFKGCDKGSYSPKEAYQSFQATHIASEPLSTPDAPWMANLGPLCARCGHPEPWRHHWWCLEGMDSAPTPVSQEVINPKEIAGSKKPAIWACMPRWVVLLVGRVMSVGAAKYGPFNYRQSRIACSTYQDAIERHSQLWFDGEDDDPETGVSHLASIMASCALLLDAQATGMLEDDRQKTGIVRRKLDELTQLLTDLPLHSRKADY